MRHAAVEVALPTPCLELRGVSYRYPGGHRAVQDLSLVLGSGILGLLGPNGAGKSTLMKMLATLAVPTQGQLLWNGLDVAQQPNALRATLGYLPQDFGVYPTLTAREFLQYLGAVKNVPHRRLAAKVDECLASVGLMDAADQRLGGFSGGMRQRVGIAQALLNDPSLLIVDEPTVGLDPAERLRFRQLMTELAGQRLVILCTHIVADVEASATTLAVMQKGRLRFAGSPQALLSQALGRVWECTVAAHELEPLRQRHTITATLLQPDGVRVRLIADQAPLVHALSATPTLEDAYMCLLAAPQP